jgi:kynurenine formamidase
VNLGSLPARAFEVSGLPLKIRGGSAGPGRVVAILAD